MKKRVDGWGKRFQGGGAMKNLSDPVASKKTAQNRFLSLVSPITRGFFRDESWKAVTQLFAAVRAVGGEMEIVSTEYFSSPDSTPDAGKRWYVQVKASGFTFSALITAAFADKPNGEVYDLTVVLL